MMISDMQISVSHKDPSLDDSPDGSYGTVVA